MKSFIAEKTAILRTKLTGGLGKPVLFCLFLSALMITICSTCSFLFATNSWIDANCIFTTARSVFHGRVLYRDVMDHKGFYIYVINMLGYLLSRRSFFGMYLVEILFFSVFLYFSYRSLRIYVSRQTAYRLLPLLAVVAAACNSFDQGLSAEEYVLPMAAASIYFMLRYLASDCDEAQMSRGILLANGSLAGIVLWMKYTMLGLWFGFMAMVFFLMLSKKQVKRAFLSCLVFLGGMAIATIPVLLYFGINGALRDCWDIYFYGNIFVYAAEKVSLSDRFSTMCRYYLRQSKGNPLVTLSVWGGILWTLFFLPVRIVPDKTDYDQTGYDGTGRSRTNPAGINLTETGHSAKYGGVFERGVCTKTDSIAPPCTTRYVSVFASGCLLGRKKLLVLFPDHRSLWRPWVYRSGYHLGAHRLAEFLDGQKTHSPSDRADRPVCCLGMVYLQQRLPPSGKMGGD